MTGRAKYGGINVPESLIKKIDRILEKRKYGYRTRPEFVNEAIRRHIEKVNLEDGDDEDGKN